MGKPAQPITDLSEYPSESKVRAVKLILQLWRKCFEGNRQIEDYFVRAGWLELINSLNGLGLGAASVLGALAEDNVHLVGVVLDMCVGGGQRASNRRHARASSKEDSVLGGLGLGLGAASVLGALAEDNVHLVGH